MVSITAMAPIAATSQRVEQHVVTHAIGKTQR